MAGNTGASPAHIVASGQTTRKGGPFMLDYRLTVPAMLTEDMVFPFQTTLDAHKDVPSSVILDLSELSFSYPFGMLLLASQIQDFVSYRKAQDTVTKAVAPLDKNEVCSYLAHIGFFQYIGLDVGKAPDEARGSGTYMPIVPVDCGLFARKARPGRLIEKRASRLAELVTHTRGSEIDRTLKFSFCETIRNVFEHAKTDECVVCAQRWGQDLEIAIIDRGRGIRKSFEEGGHFFDSGYEAIEYAIKPGTTRTSGEDLGFHGNVGFGLYVLAELCRKMGKFVLSSESSSLVIVDGQVSEWRVPFDGTAVKLRMTIPSTGFDSMVKDIMAAGERKAGILPGPPRASTSLGARPLQPPPQAPYTPPPSPSRKPPASDVPF